MVRLSLSTCSSLVPIIPFQLKIPAVSPCAIAGSECPFCMMPQPAGISLWILSLWLLSHFTFFLSPKIFFFPFPRLFLLFLHCSLGELGVAVSIATVCLGLQGLMKVLQWLMRAQTVIHLNSTENSFQSQVSQPEMCCPQLSHDGCYALWSDSFSQQNPWAF